MRSFLKLLLLCITFGLTCVGSSFSAQPQLQLVDGLANPYPAPLLLGISSWINSPPLKLSDLQGKVILIEFWTTSCPYCRSATPYLNEWYKRYHHQGLLIIAVHSPKNPEEQSRALVKDAVLASGIHYPVALDNNFETWENYNAEGWPSFYLVNPQGEVVFMSAGATNYEIIENNIRYLLQFQKKK